jgi:DNA-binding MarR family transcriptional regulator
VTEAVTQGRRAASPPRPAGPEVAAIYEQLVRLSRLMAAPQGRAANRAEPAPNPATYLVLRALDRLGPMRQGALADVLRSDASTVSRQVAALVDRDLIRRAPDDRDGRVCRLAITADGRAVLGDVQRRREARLAAIVGNWTTAEQAAFADLLHRLVGGIADAPTAHRCPGSPDDASSTTAPPTVRRPG